MQSFYYIIPSGDFLDELKKDDSKKNPFYPKLENPETGLCKYGTVRMEIRAVKTMLGKDDYDQWATNTQIALDAYFVGFGDDKWNLLTKDDGDVITVNLIPSGKRLVLPGREDQITSIFRIYYLHNQKLTRKDDKVDVKQIRLPFWARDLPGSNDEEKKAFIFEFIP